MKQSKSARGTQAGKRGGAPKTVDEYLERVPDPARSTLNKLRGVIRSLLPAETTEVISYGIPAFRHNGVVVWYAAFSDHCSLFPTASVIERFKDDLASYRISKGTIQFPTDKPLASALVKKLVKARIADMEAKKSR
jgi:uncharacterized protein YdhG (YjbR/CyaY superfamily)